VGTTRATGAIPWHPHHRRFTAKVPATLDWGPEYQVLLNKLNPLLRQIKAGRKLGLAWDVFVQAAATKVFGLVTYHTAVVPFGPAIIARLNDKITAAFRITESASPHQTWRGLAGNPIVRVEMCVRQSGTGAVQGPPDLI
jgi:hypothetical protein